MTLSLFREDALTYAFVLGPHVLTMVLCIVAPGAFALELAMSVGVLAALGLLIVVPLWDLALWAGNTTHPMGFPLLGVVLFGIQIAMVMVARRKAKTGAAAQTLSGVVHA